MLGKCAVDTAAQVRALGCRSPGRCASLGMCDCPDEAQVAAAVDDAAFVPARAWTEAQVQTALKDSGERRETSSGAVRDRSSGKGRFDLLPIYGLLEAAMQMERGAEKYNARNWEKGMPLSWFADSAHRHLLKLIAGFDDEPHMAAAIWNLLCYAEGVRRIELGLWAKEFDDMPRTYEGKQPGF